LYKSSLPVSDPSDAVPRADRAVHRVTDVDGQSDKLVTDDGYQL